MTPGAVADPPPINGYELLRVVGRGSYGDVWLARDITGQYRAVKIVWRGRFNSPRPYEREFAGLRQFAAISLVEARQLALLHVGRDDTAEFFYYVMELADDVASGTSINPDSYVPHTLQPAGDRPGRMSPPQVLGLAIDLARGLAGLHRHGLVHRDIKPSNVIFVGGVPKLADIGLVASTASARTFVGTDGFVAPEGPGAPAADVFSLGKLLYEMSTGLDRLRYPSLPLDLATLPERRQMLEFNEIILRACDPLPARRYPDANALLEDLLLLQSGESMRRMRAAERGFAQAIRLGAVLSVVSVIAAGGAWLEHRRAGTETALRRRAEAERDSLAHKAVYSAGLARAQRALELGDFGEARRRLGALAPAASDPDLRGFEWHLLRAEAQGDPADVLQAEGAPVEKIRFSRDGLRLAWQEADLRTVLWDLAAERPLRTIPGIYSLAGFSADGRWLVGVDDHARFQRWRVDTGLPDDRPAQAINRSLAAAAEGESGLCFTDGAAGTPAALRIWDFGRHAEARKLPLAQESDGIHWDFYRAAVSADDRVCALGFITGQGYEARWKLACLDLQTGAELWKEDASVQPTVLALSDDGRKLAVVRGYTGQVQLRELAEPDWEWSRTFGSSQFETAAFSPDGQVLAAGGRDSAVQLIDVATGRLLNTLHGHDGGVANLAWSPDGTALASGSHAGDVRLWRDPLNVGAHSIKNHWPAPWRSTAGGVCLSQDGRFVAVSRDGTHVDVLAADSLRPLAALPEAMRPLRFVESDHSLLALTHDGKVKRWQWDGASPAAEEVVLFKDTGISQLAFSNDERWLAVSDTAGRVQVWDWPARRMLFEQSAHKLIVWGLAFSADGNLLATVGGDRRTNVLATHNGDLAATWPSTTDVLNVVFSSRDNLMALGFNHGIVEIHAGLAEIPLRVLHTGSARITAIAFSPDGSRLVCGGPDGAVQVYATEDWREVTTLVAVEAHRSTNDAVIGLQFSGDGRVLAAYLADGRLRVWRR